MKLQNVGAYQQIKSTFIKSILGLSLFTVSASSYALTLVLDEFNNYQATIEPGVTLSRISDPMNIDFGFGPIIIDGGEFALGTSDMAMFTGQTQFGGNMGGSPRSLAANATPFTIRADDSGNLYDAFLIYFEGVELDAGSLPDLLDTQNPTAVFEITPGAPVPLPAAGWLLFSALGMLGMFKKRQSPS
ncbi:MAG: VPLPA-CTERM sorting domain-containing protein [Pseudomonadota bacterium]